MSIRPTRLCRKKPDILRRTIQATRRLPGRLHRDQQGSISIMSVFALMVLTMLLGMVMNVGRQVDGKIRMQNSADAAAYSGGVVLARGMNTLAFTNHLLCDVFSMTAFMREARDRNAQSFTPDILAAWSNVGSVFSSSGFPKFSALGPAIQQKVPMEQQLVDTYSDWAAASSERILPVMEAILAEEMIPQYQQAVVLAFPDVAQAAVREVSRRNGQPDRGREQMTAALWRSSGQPVGGDYEMFDPSLPVVDPVYGMMPNQEEYLSKSRKQRRDYSYRYLRAWNRQAMYIFDREAKMSQFGTLWRSFTSGQLKKLLDEYPYTNLPFMIRTERADMADPNWHLDRFFTFVAVTYWKNVPERMPGVFENPTQSDSQAYAAVRLFIPRSRLIWIWHRPGGSSSPPIGGVPGDFPPLPGMDTTGSSAPRGPGAWLVGRQGVPTQWDLLNQHWTCQLVPATQSSLCDILQTQPPPGDGNEDFVLPNLGGIDSEDIGRISPH